MIIINLCAESVISNPTISTMKENKPKMYPKIRPGFILDQKSNLGDHDTFPIALHFSIQRFSLQLMNFHEMNPPKITNKIIVKKNAPIYLHYWISEIQLKRDIIGNTLKCFDSINSAQHDKRPSIILLTELESIRHSIHEYCLQMYESFYG